MNYRMCMCMCTGMCPQESNPYCSPAGSESCCNVCKHDKPDDSIDARHSGTSQVNLSCNGAKSHLLLLPTPAHMHKGLHVLQTRKHVEEEEGK